MAFFEKIKDKTSEMLEISKLNSKINDEKGKIAAHKAKLADYYWGRFESGEQLDPQAMEICNAICACNDAIAAYNQEIAKIKEQSQAAAQAAAAAQPGTAAPAAETAPCAACGAPVLLNKKFCPECGAPIQKPEPEPAAPQELRCEACGEAIAPGKKFCAECGAPVGGVSA